MSRGQPDQHEERWQELLAALAPFHDSAARTARRLSRSVDDGDDLLSEAILRAFDKLPSLRDPNRFRSWFFAVMISVHRNRARRPFWKRFPSLDTPRAEGHETVGAGGPRVEEERSVGQGRGEVQAATGPAQLVRHDVAVQLGENIGGQAVGGRRCRCGLGVREAVRSRGRLATKDRRFLRHFAGRIGLTRMSPG